jgi:hypothetical protein
MSHTLSSIISFESFRQYKAEWLKFAKRLGLVFGLTGLVLISILEFICWRTAESMEYHDAAAAQERDPRLIWNARDSEEARFKLQRLAQVSPDVVVMGHSRISQFRSAMFRPYSFYNIGRLSWRLDMYCDMLRRIVKVAKPRVIVFSLDFTAFNSVYTQNYAGVNQDFGDNRLWDHFDALYDIYMMLYVHPQLIMAGRREVLENLPTIGVRAAFFSYGFRSDGSETESQVAVRSFGYNSNLAVSMPWNSDPFFFGESMGADELSQFEEFTAIARANGIQLIGVQMPIYGPAVRAIENSPRFGILKDFRAHLASGYFERQGVIVFDYMRFPPYSDDYQYFADCVHSGEVVSAAVLDKMWRSDSRVRALLPNLDIAGLDRKIEEDRRAPRHYELFKEEY